jgi:periplasmic protein TonB
MFNNLIESSSHLQEFKRRGSFLLFTTATYLVLFVITGVASIYAYDAHLESQSTELEITFMPVAPEPAPAEEIRNAIRPASNSDRTPTQSIRTQLISSVSNPNKVPDDVGIVASNILPATSKSIVGATNEEPLALPGSNRGVPGGTGATPVVTITEPPPPPPPAPTPVAPKLVRMSEGVLKGNAISLPKPVYPPIARQIGLQGLVAVQILIDEEGRVLSAKAISGHPLLIHEAQKAAMQARFTPTRLSNQPVKVSGVITYNFVKQ